MSHVFSTYNLDQLTRQAHGVWQNLAQLAAKTKEAGTLPLEDVYEAEALQNKMNEIQTLCRLALRSINELTEQLVTVQCRRDGEAVPVIEKEEYTGNHILPLRRPADPELEFLRPY